MHPSEPAWYCLRSQPKHEHIAAANLRAVEGVEVYNPRLRLRRVTRNGPMWFTESLFPNYLFARFALLPLLDAVRYTSGVKHVVQFGGRWPTVPDTDIAELRVRMGESDCLEQAPDMRPGEEINIVLGPFAGLTAVVQRYLPGKQRVRVLMELLGRSSAVDLSIDLVKPIRRYPEPLLVGYAAA